MKTLWPNWARELGHVTDDDEQKRNGDRVPVPPKLQRSCGCLAIDDLMRMGTDGSVC